jgi:PIN domain nuclease of toxin-antitoxin system
MRVLLDTHLVLDLLESKPFRLSGLIDQDEALFFVSVASLWEIAIKARLGKLKLAIALVDIEAYLLRIGVNLLPIEARHICAEVDPLPPTRDPFDRLLLAICVVESLQLATIDRALAGHPLVFGVKS